MRLKWNYYLECDVVVQVLFGYWIQAQCGNFKERTPEELETAMALAGWRPRIDESWAVGVPLLEPWYNDKIEVGMQFVWEPLKPFSAEHIKVTRILEREHDETMIYTKTLEYSPSFRGSLPTILEPYNEESRFREACLPLDRLRYPKDSH